MKARSSMFAFAAMMCLSTSSMALESGIEEAELRRQEVEMQGQFNRQFEEEQKAKEQKEATEKAAADKSMAEAKLRRKRFLNGSIKIASIQDAILAYSDDNLNILTVEGLAAAPLLTANGAMYTGPVLVEFQERNGTLRCRTDRVKPHFVFLRIKKAKSLGTPALRIGGILNIVGKYTGNAEITMTTGEERMAPILDVAYIE